MIKSLLIIGNGFDQDLGINLSFGKWRNSHHCLSYEFSRNQPKGDLWNDFEKMLRNLILEHGEKCDNTKLAKEINLYWQGFWKYFSLFFSEETKDLPEKKSVNENCAFEVLKALNESSCVYTFNYTYPYEYTNLKPKCQFNFVHGRYYKDYFVGMQPMMLQSENMIMGIDYERIPQTIKENLYIKPIIKKLNPHFEDSFIEDTLKNAENVIFFGHGLL